MTFIPDLKLFSPKEFVSKNLYYELRNKVRIFWLFDDRLLKTAVALRNRYGPMYINDWAWGGKFQASGYREPEITIGAAFSDHRSGRAIDCRFKHVTAQEVREDILEDPWHVDFKYITCLEMTLNKKPISWLHFSTRNWDKQQFGIQQLYL